MSIAITKYRVVARDKDGNIVCQGISENENAVDAVAAELRKNGYVVYNSYNWIWRSLNVGS